MADATCERCAQFGRYNVPADMRATVWLCDDCASAIFATRDTDAECPLCSGPVTPGQANALYGSTWFIGSNEVCADCTPRMVMRLPRDGSAGPNPVLSVLAEVADDWHRRMGGIAPVVDE